MNMKFVYVFLCLFTSGICAAEKSVGRNSMPERIPYVIQDRKYYPIFGMLFKEDYKYTWLYIDGNWVGFLKPKYDTNPQNIQLDREP